MCAYVEASANPPEVGGEGARECVRVRRYFPRQVRKEANERPAIAGHGACGGVGVVYPGREA